MILKPFSNILILTFLLFQAAGPAAAQEAPVSEYQVKAAFLYNFAKFVEWPASGERAESEDFLIGILGENPFGQDIQVIEGKSVKGKTIRVISSDSLDGLQNCRVLFISESAAGRLLHILAMLRGRPVLTVGDTPGFARAGVMINLFQREKRIRFEINPAAAERANLKISSHLLRLARIVYPQTGQGIKE